MIFNSRAEPIVQGHAVIPARPTRRAWLASAVASLAWVGITRSAAQTAAAADLTALSLVEVARSIAGRKVSAAEVTAAYIARIERLDAELHAFITVTADLAREQARKLAAVRAAEALPLLGAPIAHKDLFETAGIRTTAGSRLFEWYRPTQDATLVSRLTAAGAVTLGKTNTHELGGGVTTINPFFGTTRNPRDHRRIAGGSSGGSAAAVAARLVVAATGSDTGGSVRIPAALCGCVGFKPTFGLLSTAGVLGAAPTFDHAGFLTRTVPDVLPLLQASMGVDARDPGTVPPLALRPPTSPALTGVRVGVPRAYFFDTLDADVTSAMDAALARVTRAGAIVRDIRVPVDHATMARVFDPIAVAEIHQTYARDWRERPQLFSEGFASFFAAPVPGGLEVAAAHRERRRYQADLAAIFDEVDVLAMPTVPTVAPPIAGPIDDALLLRNTWPFNAARTPAISIPCGPPDRLPVGLQLVARPFDDARLLAVAAGVERALR